MRVCWCCPVCLQLQQQQQQQHQLRDPASRTKKTILCRDELSKPTSGRSAAGVVPAGHTGATESASAEMKLRLSEHDYVSSLSLHTCPAGFRDSPNASKYDAAVSGDHDGAKCGYSRSPSSPVSSATTADCPVLVNNNTTVISPFASPAELWGTPTTRGPPSPATTPTDTMCSVCQRHVDRSRGDSGIPEEPGVEDGEDEDEEEEEEDPFEDEGGTAAEVFSFNHSQFSPLSPVPLPYQNGIVSIETDNDEVQNLFVDAFLHNNRVDHMIQVMGYHPGYLDCFLKAQQYMLRGDGPLPFDYRHYIAIMAAGRHQCSYLIQMQTNEFLLQGGNELWLKGIDHIPQKLRDLYEINKILAHRPWLITKEHIEKLTRGQDNWSLSELMHAMVLLAHFHALASFIYGCGISAEIDHEEGHTFSPSQSPAAPDSGAGSAASSSSSSSGARNGGAAPVKGAMPVPRPKQENHNSVQGHSPHSNSSQPQTPNSAPETEGGIEELMEKMKKLTEEAQQEEMTPEEMLKRFERVETQSAELPAASKLPSPKAAIMRYVIDPDFTYQDFAKRGARSEIATFRAQDYSWEEHGFSLANRLYTDIGSLLDEKFMVTYNLTYYTMGDNTDVDTTSFRRSIWNYIHCMFGIRHDDYDYSEVNQLLERSLKAYIKTVTCYPERATRKDYDSFMREFKHSEKVHVNLMLFEARLQAELLYVLRAIMRYMT